MPPSLQPVISTEPFGAMVGANAQSWQERLEEIGLMKLDIRLTARKGIISTAPRWRDAGTP